MAPESPNAELVLRLALVSADPAALATTFEGWLARRAAHAGITLPRVSGRTSHRADGFALDLYRLPDRVLATIERADPREPARRWTSDFALLGGSLDLRVSVVETADMPPAPRRTGALVEMLVADPRNAFADVVRLEGVPQVLDGGTAAELVALVDAPERRLPIVAFSLPSVVDCRAFAARLAGAAHVFCLEPAASFALTETVGRWYSVFHGGVRTYPPGFRWSCPSRQAPVSLAARLSEIREGLTFEERLTRAVLALASGTYRDRPMTTVREFERQERLVREASATTLETVKSLGEELADLRAQRDALRAALDERGILIRELSAENERLHAELRAVRAVPRERAKR